MEKPQDLKNESCATIFKPHNLLRRNRLIGEWRQVGKLLAGRSEVRRIGADSSGRNQYMVFDFGPMLSSGAMPHGLFSIDVQNWDANNDVAVAGGPSDQRLVLLTDLGFLVKDSVDGSHDVFVQSIRGGAAPIRA